MEPNTQIPITQTIPEAASSPTISSVTQTTPGPVTTVMPGVPSTKKIPPLLLCGLIFLAVVLIGSAVYLLRGESRPTPRDTSPITNALKAKQAKELSQAEKETIVQGFRSVEKKPMTQQETDAILQALQNKK